MLGLLASPCGYHHAAFGYHAAKDMTSWWAETPPIARLRFVQRMVYTRDVLAHAAARGEEASIIAVLQHDGRGHNLYVIRTSESPKAATVCACLWYKEGDDRHVSLARLREWWGESATAADDRYGRSLSYVAPTTADGFEWTWAT